ncbi:AfsR/SARP family transcriptional regulator [Actinosynnema sp. CS-041913]|uniref:AfsR/SARP family transcriptional regulator n=1 Tax=Actinosynnema sp. CS-041913 TaxID=3239917 RepID=UPI003D94DA86
MVLRLLGEVGAEVDERPVHLGAPRQRCVLAALAVDAGRVVPVDRLVERVWGADEAPRARATLHSYISRLRRVLAAAHGVAIARRSSGYALIADTTAPVVDLHRFRDLCAAADAEVDDEQAARLLTDGLELWRGQALTGVDGEWAEAERDRLGQELLAARHDLAAARLRLGRGVDLVVELAERAAAHDLDERVAGQYMLALHQAGRTADALEHYRQVRTRLVEELGTDPCAALQDLHGRLLTGRSEPRVVLGREPDPLLGAERHTPLDEAGAQQRSRPRHDAGRVVPAGIRQLPSAPRSFVGREQALHILDGAHDEPDGSPVVHVLTGTAGVGKTSLALHWAHRNRVRFPGGQLFVNLRGHSAGAPLTARQALEELLQALEVDPTRRPSGVNGAAAVYRSTLADRQMLVLLDDAVDADQIRPLLPGTPDCTVVVTSRNRLDGLVAREGARQQRLDVLGADDARAVLDRIIGGMRVAAEPEAANDLVALCDGLPLALRIAAAHLAAQPNRSIGDYVTALRSGDRLAALELHGDPSSAVSAAIELSYAARTQSAQRVFRLLGLVPGPDTTAPAVAAFADVDLTDAERELRDLVAANLVEEPAPGRYALHELLRLYAADRAAQDGRAPVDRLLTWYANAVDSAADTLDAGRVRLPGSARWAGHEPMSFDSVASALGWLNAEAFNTTAVVELAAATGHHRVAWQVADGLKGYFVRGNTAHWSTVVGSALHAAQADGHPHAVCAMNNSAGVLDLMRGDYAAAVDHFESALTGAIAAKWPLGECAALSNLGILQYYTGTLSTSFRYLSRADETATAESTCLVHAGTILINLGMTALKLGRPADAIGYLTRAGAVQDESGHDRGRGAALMGLAETHLHLGHLKETEDLLEVAAPHIRRVSATHEIAWHLEVRARLAALLGDHDLAVELLEQAIESGKGHHAVAVDTQNTLAAVHCLRSRLDEAESLHRHALTTADHSHYRQGRIEALLGLATVHRHRGNLAQAIDDATAALDLARHTGHRFHQGHAHAVLAAAHVRRGDHRAGADHAEQARSIHAETGHLLGEAQALLLQAETAGHDCAEARARQHRQRAEELLSGIGLPLDMRSPGW